MKYQKVYIAGKITGDNKYREKFKAVERDLTQQGHIVLNPAELPEGMSPADYMRVCFAMIDCADAVLFMPDFIYSPGAKLEFEYCAYIRKPAGIVGENNKWRDNDGRELQTAVRVDEKDCQGVPRRDRAGATSGY